MYKSKPKDSAKVHNDVGRRFDAFVAPTFDLMDVPPSLEVTIGCGKPSLSRCGYAKVKLNSNGPMMNSMYSAFGFFNFVLF